jgi:hypothetical protein
VGTRQQIEVLTSLQHLLRDALDGRITGLSYSVTTSTGVVEAGWAGDFSGRRLVVMNETRRVIAIDDPHARVALKFGAER